MMLLCEFFVLPSAIAVTGVAFANWFQGKTFTLRDLERTILRAGLAILLVLLPLLLSLYWTIVTSGPIEN
jgi:hypothetical protein